MIDNVGLAAVPTSKFVDRLRDCARYDSWRLTRRVGLTPEILRCAQDDNCLLVEMTTTAGHDSAQLLTSKAGGVSYRRIIPHRFFRKAMAAVARDCGEKSNS